MQGIILITNASIRVSLWQADFPQARMGRRPSTGDECRVVTSNLKNDEVPFVEDYRIYAPHTQRTSLIGRVDGRLKRGIIDAKLALRQDKRTLLLYQIGNYPSCVVEK